MRAQPLHVVAPLAAHLFAPISRDVVAPSIRFPPATRSRSLCCCIIEQSINQRLEGRQEAGMPGLVPFATSRLPPSLPSLYLDQQREVLFSPSLQVTACLAVQRVA